MADIIYHPTFHHTNWIDNVDRVQAGSPNGFNARFNSIEQDLKGVENVVSLIDAELKKLGTSPPPTEKKMTLAPAFVPLGTTPAWSHDASGVAIKNAGPDTVASGMMSLNLPNGVKLLTLRAFGQNTSPATAVVRITLFRAKIVGPASTERLARATGDQNPFNSLDGVPDPLSKVDLDTYRYFIVGQANNAAPTDVVTLSAIQLTYIDS